MKWKTAYRCRTAVLFLALTAAAAAALFCGGPLGRRYSARGIRRALPAFTPGEIKQITISWRAVKTTLIRQDGRWVIRERAGRPASEPRIARLLNSLATLAPVKELAASSPETLRALHLVEDDPKTLPGVRVVLRAASGRELFRILLGKGHFVRPEPDLPPAPDAEGRYVKTGGKVYLIPVALENCQPSPSAWVEPLRLRGLESALHIAVRRFGGRGDSQPVWTVSRESAAQPFTLTQPAGKPADFRLLSGLAEYLTKPFTSDYFLPDKPCSLHLARRLTVRCADGFSYRLDLYPRPGEHCDIVELAVRYEPEKVRRLPGETEAQYARRKQILAKRFESEKRYSANFRFMASKELLTRLDAAPVRGGGGPAVRKETRP